jgi:hypothetical protein
MNDAQILGVAFDRGGKPEFLLRRQPFRVAWPIRQIENAYDPEDNRRCPLEDEKPFPSGDAEGAIQIQYLEINEPKM